MTILRFFKK